jgi:hypothetical protein
VGCVKIGRAKINIVPIKNRTLIVSGIASARIFHFFPVRDPGFSGAAGAKQQANHASKKQKSRWKWVGNFRFHGEAFLVDVGIE